MIPKELSRKEVLNRNHHGLTVRKLLDFIKKHDIPDDAPVVIERVEDAYYKKHNWGVYLKEDNLYSCRDKDGKLIKECMNQYTPAWSCVNYKDENGKILFIDLHY